MRIINFEMETRPYFILTNEMLNFSKIDYDEESVIIPFANKAFSDNAFQPIIDIIQQRVRDFYFEENFENGIASGDYSLIIWKNDDNSCTYKVQFVTDDGCDMYLQIGLNSDELKLIQPVKDKAFK